MIRPTARFGLSLMAVLAAPLASAANVSVYLSDQDDLTGSPTFGNAAISNGTSESDSFFVYVDTDSLLLGVPLDIRSTNPGIIEFTGVNFFNPYLDPADGFADTDNFDLDAYTTGGGEIEDVPDVRWASTTADPVTADKLDRLLTFSIPGVVGFGLDPALSGGLNDPRTTASGDFLLAEVTYNTLAEGSTDIYLSVTESDDLAITPSGAGAETVVLSLGSGEASTLTGETGQGAFVGGSPVTGNLIADAVITVADVVGLEGDYNSDGFVSQGDLDLVLLNWGDTVAPAGFNEDNIPGGGPFDSLMSQNELDGVLLNWGDGTPPALNAVPEPTSLALLGLGGLALLRRRG